MVVDRWNISRMLVRLTIKLKLVTIRTIRATGIRETITSSRVIKITVLHRTLLLNNNISNNRSNSNSRTKSAQLVAKSML